MEINFITHCHVVILLSKHHLHQDELLMRALRDFNTPKIPAQDTPIFLRLISDLFMGLDAQLKVNESLKKIVQIVTKEEKYQLDESFILKVLQFQELLDVRHSVMLLGISFSHAIYK
jgi:dynein heavy chain